MNKYFDVNRFALDRSVPPQWVEVTLGIDDRQSLRTLVMGEHLLLVVGSTQNGLVRIRRESYEIGLQYLR